MFETRTVVSFAAVLPNLASHIRAAFSSIAWKTGSRSPGSR